MTHDKLLSKLFPAGHNVIVQDGLVFGGGTLGGSQPVHVIGVAERSFLGVEGAIALAEHVLSAVKGTARHPILVLVDSRSQRMSRHDELMGLNEFLAHLAKCLLLAAAQGHRTVALLYGGSAAGAFIATALACDTLLALPGANPEVMDLPSIARVTKLPLEKLQEMAAATPVFAPGLENFAQTGAVAQTLDPAGDLAAQVLEALSLPPTLDERDRLGAERGGRPRAAEIAARVCREAKTA
ncbi:MAG: biotin-independent malonate decarboxylase subunit gamma [Proteobacteria bacterium]|nr:biotin-independent malonate decarboxylase subunit gamma [Pseudomonadota bacterium]